jgi:hypothetical protein
VARELDELLDKGFKRLINTSGQVEKEQPQLSVHKSTLCDRCGISPIIGTRYSCLICQNFDLCEYCENADTHPKEHPMIKLKEPIKAITKQVEGAAIQLSINKEEELKKSQDSEYEKEVQH